MAELLEQERSRARAAGDNTGETERFLVEYMQAYDEHEARMCRPSVPRSGRRFLPVEIRVPRRRIYVTFAIMLAIWLITLVYPSAARLLG